IVGEHPERTTIHAGERGDDARPETAAQLQYGVLVKEPVEYQTHVIDLSASFGDDVPQTPLIGHAHVIRRATEIGEVALGGGARGAIVWDAQVDHAICVLHLDRAHLGGLVDAQPATLDHRRAAHPDTRVLGGDDHIAAPK